MINPLWRDGTPSALTFTRLDASLASNIAQRERFPHLRPVLIALAIACVTVPAAAQNAAVIKERIATLKAMGDAAKAPIAMAPDCV